MYEEYNLYVNTLVGKNFSGELPNKASLRRSRSAAMCQFCLYPRVTILPSKVCIYISCEDFGIWIIHANSKCRHKKNIMVSLRINLWVDINRCDFDRDEIFNVFLIYSFPVKVVILFCFFFFPCQFLVFFFFSFFFSPVTILFSFVSHFDLSLCLGPPFLELNVCSFFFWFGLTFFYFTFLSQLSLIFKVNHSLLHMIQLIFILHFANMWFKIFYLNTLQFSLYSLYHFVV